MLKTAIFGSYVEHPDTASDIDVIILANSASELIDGIWQATNMANRVGKPVDIWINPQAADLCQCMWYNPHEPDRQLDTGYKLNFDQRFAGAWFFTGAKEVDLKTIGAEQSDAKVT